ncbi:MAG: C69 family dipeptidase [Bacteroidales bacterium]|nr:C69 family dipeptidase [Bacteroidales bacterium]
MKRLMTAAVLLLGSLCALKAEDGFNCFGMIAGKDCTTDGYVLIGHNEDDPGEQLLNIYPTDKYLWVEFPTLWAGDAFLTRTGVAVVSDNCRSREDKPMLTDGGIFYRLRVEVAKRAQSARDGMHIIGELVEKYGYGDSGRSYLLADAEEGWIVSVVNGKHWVAQRIPDDQIMLIPNYYVIDKVNLDDTVNFAGSKDIISYAIQRGWYNPSKDGEFSFRKAYSSGKMLTAKTNLYRHKAALDYFRGGYADPNAEHPFSFKPAKKVSVQEMINALSLHNPNDVGTGSISGKSTVVSTIFQLRGNMPKELGCVMWTAMGHPCIEAYIPWHLGLKKAPEGWNRFESWEEAEKKHFGDSNELRKFYPDCRYWRYADRWAASKDDIINVEKQRKVLLKPFQKMMFKEAKIFEKKMMNKYGNRFVDDPESLAEEIRTFLNGCYKQYDLL